MKKRLIALLVLAAMLCTLFAACGGDTASDTTTENTENPAGSDTGAGSTEPDNQPEGVEGVSDETITVAYNTEVNNFYFSGFALSSAGDDFGSYVNAGLVSYDNITGEVRPALAKDWEMVDDCTYRFYLVDNAVSHNGYPLTAQDVVDSFARTAETAALNKYTRHFDIDKCKVVDELTVDIVTTHPWADTLPTLAMSCFFILSTEGLEANGGPDGEGQNPQAGFGPYKFVEWMAGDHVTFERDDNYWGELPYYKTAIVRIITDDSARLMNLQSGDVAAVNRVLPSQVSTVEGDSSITVYQDSNVNQMYSLQLNNQSGPLKDVNVRRALSMAINRDGAVASVFNGYATPADGFFATTVPVYVEPDPDAADYFTYDLETAKQLLEEAGYGDGFELTLITMEQQIYTSIAEYANMQWAQLGVTVNIEISDSPTFFSKLNSGEYDVASIATSGVNYTNNASLDGRLDYSEGGTLAFTDGGQEFYDLIDTIQSTTKDSEEFQEAMAAYQNMIRDLVPTVSVCNGDVIYALNSELTGVTTHVMGDPNFVFIRPAA